MISKTRIFLSLCPTHLKSLRQIHQKISAEWLPKIPKIDDVVSHKFNNLPPDTKIRIDTTLTSPGEKLNFLSSCIFPVDSKGTLDLSTASCDGPSYTGVDPMGIFWSMDPQPGSLTRLYSSGPLSYALDIFDMEKNKLFSTCLIRQIYDHTVSRQDVKKNGIYGTLFIPSGEGPFPSVVVLEGAARIKEDLAASLAMKGFVVFTLAFFNQPGLPPDYSHVRVEYFERAIELLQGQPSVQSGGVGLLGCSKGCDVSLSCATFLPPSKVRAVATVNGGITSLAGITTYKDTTIQKHGFRSEFVPKPGQVPDSVDFLGLVEPLADVSEECMIPIERSEADILMVAGEDDHNFESVEWAKAARKRCEYFGKTNFCVQTYPGMGHALDAPFSPVGIAIPHMLAPRGTRVYLGGVDKKAAAHSQVKSFKHIVNFFRASLKLH